jgi:hypothetical protein
MTYARQLKYLKYVDIMACGNSLEDHLHAIELENAGKIEKVIATY